ncbi:P-loop containing nucleoside triphosphate hydrolase [Arabidopsis suecica]|uniref:P-loop containing nucleoside triphosphate hydrolase n=1 Tax=Arabidopsis suecica TaxID=45249 RepID=A0A8T1XNR6_ARASU|nr:P-loop containing nucleoside triphosphate hydrolase [Arabidopsis suecica]
MAPEISVYGGVKIYKRDFTARFHDQYENRNAENKEPKTNHLSAGTSKTNHLCAGTLKKRGQKAEEDRVETDSDLPGNEIYGFTNEIKSLENFLLDQKVDNEFKSLVIVGEYGVGKTALCKVIFNNKYVKSVYAPRIWVSMHSNESKERLDGKICVLKKILTGLGVKDLLATIKTEAEEEHRIRQEVGVIEGETTNEKEFSVLLYALHLNLRWKKFLIVFDDVRDEDNWDEKLDEKFKEGEKWGKHLSDGFPKESGGRVIYTTREKKLAQKLVAEEHEIHRLWPLTDSESVWNIYKEALIENEEEPPRNDEKCIIELMNKSRGLPLAARLLATLLPVFLDGEKADQKGYTHGPADSANNPTS